jgi:uncharacterized protein (DUF488 family)
LPSIKHTSELPAGETPPIARVLTVWTIGHSTRPLEVFLALLASFAIDAVADVRSFPGSRRHPQFGKHALEAALAEHGIAYRWLPSLGGRRRPVANSPNTAWRNPSFRGYADYMQTTEFAAGLADLVEVARVFRTSIMCAESLWWRCHRSMIADALLARGIHVEHILGTHESEPHLGTAPARIVDGRLTYAAPETGTLSLL